jgi:hypothetical protein
MPLGVKGMKISHSNLAAYEVNYMVVVVGFSCELSMIISKAYSKAKQSISRMHSR